MPNSLDTCDMSSTLKFQYFQTIPDVTFWTAFTQLKLTLLKLAESPVPLQGFYTPSNHNELPGPLKLNESSLDNKDKTPEAVFVINGELLNYNTIEGFKKANRGHLLDQIGRKILDDIKSGHAEANPDCLCRFLLTSYADLKTYKYYYWFAFPAFKLQETYKLDSCQNLVEAFGQDNAELLARETDADMLKEKRALGFWATPQNFAESSSYVLPFSAGSNGSSAENFICFIDPSNSSGEPGWILRNILFLIAYKWKWKKVSVISWQMRKGKLSTENSRLLQISIPEIPSDWYDNPNLEPQLVGWAPNPKGQLGPKMLDLSSSMDPTQMAVSAANLNIRLMKWRAAPKLDIEKLSSTKCLLLGAGTLGCAVARTLLGWGVKNITFIDNSKVAYSNPVRQSLYEFSDCIGEGKLKARAAAKKLKEIFPAVISEGIEMNIPMPGHPLSPSEIDEAKMSAEKLEDLVKSHDAIFLLMDTRESRWLPTLFSAVHDKLVINAALGFDSFLVMRHGGAPNPGVDPKSRLGCYYCNDIVAPLNSTNDRTLDQQCTVARPGLAPIAGALAVEMMAAVVQDPLGGKSQNPNEAQSELPLGSAPHMIRGQLSNFSQQILTGHSFSQCTACSEKVVNGYKTGGWDWLFTALQDPKTLEDLTGLTEMMASMSKDDFSEDKEGMIALDSDEDFEEI